MSLISQTELEQTVNRLQQEAQANLDAQVEKLTLQISGLQSAVATGATAQTATRPTINNMTRNGDHRHSVDSWFNAVPATGDELNECANVYAYPALDQVKVFDATIDAASNAVNCATSNPFTVSMNGTYMIIEGAGEDGEALSGIITYVSASQATLSVAAATSVAGANARIGCRKLAHKNTKNASGDAVNDALKDAAHAHFAENISDPSWRRNFGDVQIGSRNVAAYPFGYFADDGATYVPLHQLFSGRTVFARFNIAKANRFVKIKGRLFVGIYNNNERVLDFVKGNKFQVTTKILGAPATTGTAEYFVVIETGSGFSIISDVIAVENAPSLAAFNAGARVKLNWTRFAGAINTKIYRRLGTGDVYKLEEVSSIENEYTDTNNPTRQNIGADFPVVSNAQDTIASYYATALGALDDLPNNAAGESFQPIEVFLPFAPSVNMALLFDPHLVIGLTEPLATEVTDAISDGAGNISSASGAFTAAMTGKAFILRHQETNRTASGAVAGFTSANNIQLSPAPDFAAPGCILEIGDSQPGGLIYDLVGTALTETSSDWDFHPDDNNRRQQGASNPAEGSTQGGTTGSDGYGGGTGIVPCVLDEVRIKVRGASNTDIIEKRADDVLLTDLLWNGCEYSDNDFNEIDWIRIVEVSEIIRVITPAAELPCTKYHRLATSEETKQSGVAVSSLMIGNKTLRAGEKFATLETILDLRRETGNFKVVSFGLKEKHTRRCHLLVTNDLLSHNRKRDDFLLPEEAF